jgi:hypothetical protein
LFGSVAETRNSLSTSWAASTPDGPVRIVRKTKNRPFSAYRGWKAKPKTPCSLLVSRLVVSAKNTLRVGMAKLVMTMIRPVFSTMKSRLVSPGGWVMARGCWKVSPGNASINV